MALHHPCCMLHRRGVLNLDCALAVGHSARYAGEANRESYMELVVRCRATSTADTHILKANHPDDARNWVRDLQARLRTGCVWCRLGLSRWLVNDEALPVRPDASLQQQPVCARPPQSLLDSVLIGGPSSCRCTAAKTEINVALVQDLWRCQRQAPLPSNKGFLATPVTGVASRSGKLRLLR